MTNWTQAEHPVAPWDSPGLLPRSFRERCANHDGQCVYRDDDPAHCPMCHSSRCRGSCTASDLNVADAAPMPVGNRRQINARLGWATCGGCGESWSGRAACHCAGCHQTFASISSFDKHRIGSFTDPKNPRRCADPSDRGLVPVFKKYWSGWALAGERPTGDLSRG